MPLAVPDHASPAQDLCDQRCRLAALTSRQLDASRRSPCNVFLAFTVAVAMGGAWASLPGSSAVAASDLVEDQGYFRVVIDGRPVRLEGLVVKRADAPGRLPVALIVHGKPVDLGGMASEHTDVVARQARDLAARGWLAVAAMHRGFGQSDGPYPAGAGCDPGVLKRRFSGNADELEAVLSFIKQRPDADPTRVIAIGVSAGGADVVTLAARNPAGLRGVVSVSGGLRVQNCGSWQDNLVAAYRGLGTASKVPQLWLYAKNDSFFPLELVDRMHAAALDGGADVKLVMFDTLGDDGHKLFGLTAGRALWLRELDAFLRYLKLPTWQLDEVDALIAKIKTQARSKSFLESYFSDPLEKALAYSRSSNSFADGFGSLSLDMARDNALKSCGGKSSDCVIVMENDKFVGEQP
jgi:dienelactone hydrolase